MINRVIDYSIMVIILILVIFQQQSAVASSKESVDNKTAESRTAIPELPVNSNTTQPHSELAPGTEDPPNDEVVHCAALGCPGNPPNPHGPPTEEPEGDG
jgi:hypothetical protein